MARALLVGVSAYPLACHWPALQGPRQDVAEIRATLLAGGVFQDENVRLLLDQEATHAAIAAGFREVVKLSKQGDLIFFFFAGHGSQVPDQTGEELDGMDETLIPYDGLDLLGRRNDILDKEISSWIDEANRVTDQVVLVFDCCSSGTMARSELPKGLGMKRYVDPAPRGLGAKRASAVPDKDKTVARPGSGWVPKAKSYVALSACRASESAFELSVPTRTPDGKESSEVHGLFTHELAAALRAADASWSYADLMLQVGVRMDALFAGSAEGKESLHQTPVLEGKLRGQSLFRPTAAPRARRFALSVSKRELVLGAGALQGLAPGAALAVGPVDAPADVPAERVGRVRITQAYAERALVEWIEGPREGELPAQLSAYLLEPGAEKVLFPVSFADEESEHGAPSRALLADAVVASVPRAEARLVLALSNGRWQARSPAHALLFDAQAGDDAEEARFRTNVVRLANSYRLQSTLAAAPPQMLKGHMEIVTVDAEGNAGAPLAAQGAQRASAASGTKVAVRVHNDSKLMLYVTVVYASPDGSIDLAREPTLDDLLPPGEALMFPEQVLGVDAGYENLYASEPLRVYVVLSPRLYNLSCLQQEAIVLHGVRGASQDGKVDPELECEAWAALATEFDIVAKH